MARGSTEDQKDFGLRNEQRARIGQGLCRVRRTALRLRPRRDRRHAMRGFEPRFVTETREDDIRVHLQIARIGPHIARDETGCIEGGDVAILDRGDIAGANAQLSLHVQQRLAHRRTLAPHEIAQTNFEIVSIGAREHHIVMLCRSLCRQPDHSARPNINLPVASRESQTCIV